MTLEKVVQVVQIGGRGGLVWTKSKRKAVFSQEILPNVEVTHQPVAIFIASILGTLTVAAVITTAVCCFKKKRGRVPGAKSYDVNPVYGTVYYHQDRCF